MGTGHLPIGKPTAYRQQPTMRLYNPATGRWLHQSGTGETADVNYSWSGSAHQARKLRDAAAEWPYRRAAMNEGKIEQERMT